jgi:hypothetical protein
MIEPTVPPLSEAERAAIVDAVIEELAAALVEDILDARQAEAETNLEDGNVTA